MKNKPKTILIKNQRYIRAVSPFAFGQTVTLYHGANDLDESFIRMEGLKPLNPQNTINRILADYGLDRKDVPDEIIKMAMHRRVGERRIYFTSIFNQAVGYAKSYAAGRGGEFGFELRQRIEKWAKRDHKSIPRLLAKGKPIVVEVEIPWKKLSVWGSQSPESKVRSLLAKAQMWETLGYISLEEYLEKNSFEWMADEQLPPTMISKIHKLN